MADENNQHILQAGDDSGAKSDDINNSDEEFTLWHPSFRPASPSKSEVLDRFIGMGFPGDLVSKSIEEHGWKNNEEKLLEKIHSYIGVKEKQKIDAEDDSGAKRYDIINLDPDSEDELEIENNQPNWSSRPIITNGEASSSHSKRLDDFIQMGFPAEIVSKVIEEYGEDADEGKLIEEILSLAYKALEETENTAEPQQAIQQDPFSSEGAASSWSDFSDSDEDGDSILDRDALLAKLLEMGFKEKDALLAVERSDENSKLQDLVDLILAAEFERDENTSLTPEERPINDNRSKKKRKEVRFHKHEPSRRKKPKGREKIIIINEDDEDDEDMSPSKSTMGFTNPFKSTVIQHRSLPEDVKGPPYFYFENVKIAPKPSWKEISRSLYNVEPEFVDSFHFCAAVRKRGYVHNLPIENRFSPQSDAPLTVQDAIPHTRKWWPSWDTRTKLNCVVTRYAYGKLMMNVTKGIRRAVKKYNRDPPKEVKEKILGLCREWNLVWVARNRVAKLEPHDVETLMGFPVHHTSSISTTDRYKSLGNGFQVDTVAYHLSVLKEMYPNGINVLSLFSGIGGAEVALHRLGIPLNNVVSVENSKVNRFIFKCWWEQTNQQGNLIKFHDVRDLTDKQLDQLIDIYGGFDLIIGGSPCNNLAGRNRHTRVGLMGEESILFFEFVRILKTVRSKMAERQQAHERERHGG